MVREDQPQEAPDPAVESVGPPWMRRRRRHIVRRVGGHMETRVSFGVLTLCTMGLAAAAMLLISGVAGGIVYLLDNQSCTRSPSFSPDWGSRPSPALRLALGFIGLPFAGDWFLEWPSHVLGWSIGAGRLRPAGGAPVPDAAAALRRRAAGAGGGVRRRRYLARLRAAGDTAGRRPPAAREGNDARSSSSG